MRPIFHPPRAPSSGVDKENAHASTRGARRETRTTKRVASSARRERGRKVSLNLLSIMLLARAARGLPPVRSVRPMLRQHERGFVY